MPYLHGAQHQRAKLTDTAVRSIRSEYEPGQTTLQQLADRYGVTKQTVSAVVNGRTWRHLLD